MSEAATSVSSTSTTPAGNSVVNGTVEPVVSINSSSTMSPADSGIGQTEQDISLDELIGADFGDDPIMQGTHKGIPDYKKILEHIPENGRKLVQNLRASYTQKTTEIAELRQIGRAHV